MLRADPDLSLVDDANTFIQGGKWFVPEDDATSAATKGVAQIIDRTPTLCIPVQSQGYFAFSPPLHSSNT